VGAFAGLRMPPVPAVGSQGPPERKEAKEPPIRKPPAKGDPAFRGVVSSRLGWKGHARRGLVPR